jgi:hypothetical protein
MAGALRSDQTDLPRRGRASSARPPPLSAGRPLLSARRRPVFDRRPPALAHGDDRPWRVRRQLPAVSDHSRPDDPHPRSRGRPLSARRALPCARRPSPSSPRPVAIAPTPPLLQQQGTRARRGGCPSLLRGMPSCRPGDLCPAYKTHAPAAVWPHRSRPGARSFVPRTALVATKRAIPPPQIRKPPAPGRGESAARPVTRRAKGRLVGSKSPRPPVASRASPGPMTGRQ